MGVAFHTTLEQVAPRLTALSNWGEPLGPGKWTRLELLGHLLDSAANNHQRFVRALAQPALEWPGYDQDACVRVQRFAEADPQLLVNLVLHFNRYLAWLIAGFPESQLGVICHIGDNPPMTLEQLALDYIAHCEHHLKQLVGEAGIEWSGMPWPPAR